MIKVPNGIANHVTQNGVSGKIREAVTEGARIANGVIRNGVRQNGSHAHMNGAANGAQNFLQNGVGMLANGIPPGINRVAPAPISNRKDSIKKMYNEVDGYHENLHI